MKSADKKKVKRHWYRKEIGVQQSYTRKINFQKTDTASDKIHGLN